MSKHPLKYLRLQSGDALPALDEPHPFKTIVVIEEDVSQIWQWDASRWLIESGCGHVMAWGKDCASWEESVNEAGLEAFNYEDIPADRLVVTTSHEDEDLSEVFWFAKHRASHPVHELRNTLILHISPEGRKIELESAFEEA